MTLCAGAQRATQYVRVFSNGDSSLACRGTSPNSPGLGIIYTPLFVKWQDWLRVSDRVRNRDKLHLWLWRNLAMAAPNYGGPEPDKIRTSALSD